MCTVTAIRQLASLRIVMNRDEQRTRPAGLGPTVVTIGLQQALTPLDPLSGGTWIACNRAGLAAALLNMAPGHAPHPTRPNDRSRGHIIPALLAAHTIAHATDLALALPAPCYPPFRLLLATTDRYALLSSSRDQVKTLESGPLDRPIMLTSSGLGDDLVQAHRCQLFGQLLAAASTPDHLARQAQDRFHRTAHPDDPSLGVLMHRHDARTVSITTLTLTDTHAEMLYNHITDEAELPAESASLPLRSQPAAELIP